MFEARINLTNALGPAWIARLARQIDFKVGQKMEYWGNVKLSQYKDETQSEPTAIMIDGYAGTRSAFKTARRQIQIVFIRRLVSLAIDGLVAAMRAAIAERTSAKTVQWTNIPRFSSDVVVFYGGSGKPFTEVSVSEITTFEPGDAVLVVPRFGLQMYSNASKFRGEGPGVFAAASRSIRALMRAKNKRTALSVRAERSRAAFYKMIARPGALVRPDGSQVDMTIPWAGADSLWVIAIRYRKNFKGDLNG